MTSNKQYILIDNSGHTVIFTDLKVALTYMKNTAKYDKKFHARLYEAVEKFNTDCFDMDSIREKEMAS
jgi:hypothetical protein